MKGRDYGEGQGGNTVQHQQRNQKMMCVCVSVCVHVCLCVCVFFLHCGIKKMHTAHKLMGTFSNVGTAFLSPMSFFEGESDT